MAPRIPVARPELGDEEIAAVAEVIRSGWLTQGPVVAQFERDFAALCGARDAVAVSSCTTALHLSLVCAGVGPGDEVIVPSMSFIATANAVRHAGAAPVFAEVEPDTFNLDVSDVARRIGPRTRAVIVVDQLGLPADLAAFEALCRERGLALVEDAACAIGSAAPDGAVGSRGRFVCFSFHPRKVLTTGDGGMVATDDPGVAARLRRLRHHGMDVSDAARHASASVVTESYGEAGFNYRMTDVQAAIGRVQLTRLPSILGRRIALADAYDAHLRGHPAIATPVRPAGVRWNVQTYAVRLRGFGAARRDEVMARLLARGIASRRGVMTAHREPAYADAAPVSLPVSEQASDGSLMLPLYASMTLDECAEVARELIAAVERPEA